MEINKPITIIIFLTITVVLAFLFVLPEYEQYHLLQQKVLETQAQYSGESIYYARVSDILAGLETRKEVLTKIQSALPADFALAPLVGFLQKKGAENGVSIKSIVFSQVSPLLVDELGSESATSPINDVLFTLTVNGSYQGLKGFLFALDNSARLFEMDTVSFSALENVTALKNKPQEYSLKLEVKTHAY